MAGAEEMRQNPHHAIECGGALDVMHVDGDLPDPGECGVFGNVHGDNLLLLKLVSIANYISWQNATVNYRRTQKPTASQTHCIPRPFICCVKCVPRIATRESARRSSPRFRCWCLAGRAP